jgi:thymidylate synthase ThyX
MIKAEVVCDSVSPQGIRLTTFSLRFPKFILAEFNTHCMLSRSASSSRAIPTTKMLMEVRHDDTRAAPEFWGAEQRGMSPGGELSSERGSIELTNGVLARLTSPKEQAQGAWRLAALAAADWAEQMLATGAHKSLVNRILDPYVHSNVVATATEWMNFFGLRLHKDADPTMRALANAMWEARSLSTPQTLLPGQWHLPFASDKDTWDELESYVDDMDDPANNNEEWIDQLLIKVSVARCARVSYQSNETGKRSTVEEDLKLYERLVGSHPMHASPAEHQATPDEIDGPVELFEWHNKQQHGKLTGWRCYRKMLPGEVCAPLPEGYSQ